MKYKKEKENVRFMHTIKGEPGFFDGDQVCHAIRTRPIKLADSLQQIHQEQNETIQWRHAKNFEAIASNYGYVRVEVGTVK